MLKLNETRIGKTESSLFFSDRDGRFIIYNLPHTYFKNVDTESEIYRLATLIKDEVQDIAKHALLKDKQPLHTDIKKAIEIILETI